MKKAESPAYFSAPRPSIFSQSRRGNQASEKRLGADIQIAFKGMPKGLQVEKISTRDKDTKLHYSQGYLMSGY